MAVPTLESKGRSILPNWAVRQRDLVTLMNRAAVPSRHGQLRSALQGRLDRPGDVRPVPLDD